MLLMTEGSNKVKEGISVGYILIIGFLAYAALEFYKVQKKISVDLSNRGTLAPGVSYYCNLAVSQRPHQILAFQATNADMSTTPGYAPAFGPTENMPGNGQEVFF